jgi:phage N-6-adenine-methyltransferase
MSLLRFKARNHPQQVALRGPEDDTDDRRTPDDLWLPLHEEFGFTLDAAARPWNSKTPRHCTDGLAESWAGERVWCNPPFSDVRPWVEKAWSEDKAEVVVMLLPANRVEQRWWQELVEPHRDRGGVLSVRFLSGRQRFDRPGWTKPAKGDRPPFGCALLVWKRHAIDCDMDDDCRCAP